MRIQMGQRMRDKITLFEGVVVGKTEWLTGCNTFGLQSEKTTEDGKPLAAQWFDENRLEPVEGADRIDLSMGDGQETSDDGQEEPQVSEDKDEDEDEERGPVQRAVPRRTGGPHPDPQRSVEPGEV